MAEEKASALDEAGADVLVTSEYDSSLLEGIWLVVVTDGVQGTRVAADAEKLRIFCNVADVPEHCSFILPALHRGGEITVAVSTGGASPALAQHLRDEFAASIGPEHEQLAAELRELRPWAKAVLPSYADRRDFFRTKVKEALG